MLDFQQKRKIRSIAYNKITLVVLVLLILIMARSTWIIYSKKQASGEIKNVALLNVEQLRERSEELNSKIKRLETTPGIEEEIRLKYDVVKEKENMVIVVENEKNEVSTTSEKIGLWQRIMDLLWK